nr:MAG: hypothetical protein BECKDK2373C_GA0170839_10994 [Candidatus Kentron sp. DK]
MWKYLVDPRNRYPVIRHHRPLYGIVLWSTVFLSLGVIIYLICISRFEALVEHHFSIGTEKKHLQSLNVRLTSQNSLLRDRVAILERAAQIDRIAYEEINKTVESLQDEAREAKEELLFYQGLVTSSEQGQGFRIQSLELQSGDSQHSYHYRIVLTRFQKDDRVIKGILELSVVGHQEGEPDRLELSDMTLKEPERLAFEFRNFHKMEGYLILPTGFTPHRLVVTVDLQGKDAGKIVKTIDWSSALD